MTDLNDFAYVDGFHDVLAAYINKLVAGNLRGELTNTQTLSANLTLSDASLQIENLTPSSADRTVFLPPEAVTNHLFVFMNASSVYSLLIKDDSGGTTFATVGPGKTAQVVPMGGTTWGVLGGVNGREVLTAARTYYVRTDGNDANNGLSNTSGGAFLTIQKALDVRASIDGGIYAVDIQVADGTYTGTIRVSAPFLGSGAVTIKGNNSTPANVIISTTSNDAILVSGGATLYLQDFEVRTTTSGQALYAQSGASIYFINLRFGATASGHITVVNGNIQATGSYSIVGNASQHISIFGGVVRTQTGTITLTGTPAFSSAFLSVTSSGTFFPGATYSGSATGKRYDVTTNGVIFGATSETQFPGNALGTRSSGGQYGSFLGNTRVSTQFDKSNVTQADITGLSVSVLAGRTYRFRAVLYTTSNSASGVFADVYGTCTATSIIGHVSIFNAGSLSASARIAAMGGGLGVTAVTVAAIFIDGTITVNAAGTLTVRFATNVGTNTSSVLVGSTFEVVDIT